jgi:hypothetical protein
LKRRLRNGPSEQRSFMKTNYVLIDYENVQPPDLSALEQEHFRVLMFVGSHQTKIPYEIAEALQRMGVNGKYVKASGSGPNALDFHIAFYLGELSAKEPEAYFHIVSKDVGFDPLVKHLKARKLFAARVKEIGDIPLLRASNAKSVSERLAVILDALQRRGAAKPRTLATLTSTIKALFQKQLSDDETTGLLTEMQAQGYVAVKGTRVSYNMPA